MRHLRAEDVLKELVRVLKTSRSRLRGNSWKPLTSPLRSCLRRLGRNAGYTVWDRKHGGEYLYDIVWSYGEPESARRYWLELTGEIELTDPDFQSQVTDFYKVLDAKARLKLFVCAPPARKRVRPMCDEIDWAISHQRFCLPEERLIAIVLDYDRRADRYLYRARLFNRHKPIGKWSDKWEEVTF